MFAKIIIWFLAFLMWLFPNWGNNQLQYLIRTNSTDIAAPKIISAIKEKDVAALEALMCKNIKDNVENLTDKVSELINAIEGEITSSRWGNRGSYQETGAGGRRIVQTGIEIFLTTPSGTYYLSITWETANNFAIDEVGIRSIGLIDPSDNILIRIAATEGVGEWHD
jgi:hypothetical protein